jgi:hypothetical protein
VHPCLQLPLCKLAAARRLPVAPRSAQRLCARCGAPTGPDCCSSARVVLLNAAAAARLSRDLPRKGGLLQRNQAAAVKTCAVRGPRDLAKPPRPPILRGRAGRTQVPSSQAAASLGQRPHATQYSRYIIRRPLPSHLHDRLATLKR